MEYKVLKGRDDKKFVISNDASSYGLDSGGREDCTQKLQKAIDDCAAAGGGTVYLPAGRYALYGKLVIKTSVMLHGASEDETILCCFYGRGSTEGMQICMEACTGLIGVTLYYPEQDMENPVPYPPTVKQNGADSITVEKVTFVNPWIAISCGPDGNELHFVKDVRMSPLYQGIFMDMTTDIGRMQEVSISPAWYEQFIQKEKLEDAVCVQRLTKAAAAYMFANATGIYMARSDWEYGYHISIEGCNTGLLVTSNADCGPNTQICGLRIHGCETGIRLHRGNPYGVAITDSQISSGDNQMKTAILCDETFISVLQCYGLTVEGTYEHLIRQEGNGQLSFAECRFNGKGREEDVLLKAGGLSLLNTVFRQGGVHIRVKKGAGAAQIVGCTAVDGNPLSVDVEKDGNPLAVDMEKCGNPLSVDMEKCGNPFAVDVEKCSNPLSVDVEKCSNLLAVDVEKCSNPLTIDVEEGTEEVLLREEGRLPVLQKKRREYLPYPYATEPDSDALYVVTQFGGLGDGHADDTAAFEQALTEAGKTGGYVYVPGGKYRITRPLRVPEGVELRGTAEVPCHTMGGGSVLMVCCGKGEEEGAPFLSLKGNCGIRGLVLYHPEQDPIEPHPYPWTVQAQGDRCYAINTVFVNAWKGLDFGSMGGADHYISYVSGAPIRCGIFASGNEGGIWVENVQYNPHYWYRCDLPGRPEGDTWKSFWHNQIKYLDAFVYGANEDLHVLNTFVFAARNGVHFIEQNQKGSKGIVIGHGTDGGECGIRIDSLKEVEFVNTELVTIESPNRRIYLRNRGTGAAFYNTLMWGAPDTAVLLEGGELRLLLTNIVDSGDTAIVVENGEADILAAYFYRRERQLSLKGGKVRFLANMTVRPKEKDIHELKPTDIAVHGGEVTEAFNWFKPDAGRDKG